MINLKLSQKGIALVCLPLCFQIVFLVVLINSLLHAEAAIKKEAASRRVIYTASNVTRRTFDAATAAAIYNFTRDPAFKEKCLQSMKAITSDYLEIADEIKDNPKQLRRLAACQSSTKEAEVALSRLLYKIDENTELLKVFDGNDGLTAERRLMSEMTVRGVEFLEAERIQCESFVEQERRARHFVVVIIVIGIVLNLLIAVAAAFYFFRSIVSRLERLTQNTLLISERKLASVEIGGSDEITDLDRAFHRAVNELQTSEEMRRQLVAMVSHDLRSPLASVDAALTLMNEGVLGELPENVQAVSKNASADIARLVKLTNDLLDAESLASGNVALRPKSVSVQSLFNEAFHSMEFASLSYGVSIELTPADFNVHADPDRINQVLCNLIGNAIKFSPKGSKVILEASQGKETHEFRVIDSGIGIAQEDQAIIFDRFSKLGDASNPGKGLGLAICKALIELHGGKIGVRSTAGAGSTFWFSLPVAPEDLRRPSRIVCDA